MIKARCRQRSTLDGTQIYTAVSVDFILPTGTTQCHAVHQTSNLSTLKCGASKNRKWERDVGTVDVRRARSPCSGTLRRTCIRSGVSSCSLAWRRALSGRRHTPVHISGISCRRSVGRLRQTAHWDPYAMHRGGCQELYYCRMVEWSCWDSSLIRKTNWFTSVLWHCWFGHITCKNRPGYDLL